MKFSLSSKNSSRSINSPYRSPRHRCSKQSRATSRRRGAAVVEFAVCLPVIVLVVLGSIEGASLLFLRQALVQSAYEGVKVAIKQDAVEADVINIATAVTDGRRLEGVVVETTPADITSVPQGDFITVRITAPVSGNTMIPGGVFTLTEVSAQAVMVKE